MREYSRKNLNIVRLLEMGDLDIRKIAEQNPAMVADEYFEQVEQLIEDAADLRATAQSSDGLVRMKSALSGVGYLELNPAIEQAFADLQRGDAAKAAASIGEVEQRFGELFERLKSAYTVRKFALSPVIPPSGLEPPDPILLPEAMVYFDWLEANRKLRILAVDDVSVVLNAVTSILSPYYEVFALKSSTQVENFLRHTTPELFLLDIEMGELSGFDLIPLIRQFPEHRDTPIIFLTGNASLNNLKDAIALGAKDFITKPLDREILLEKIEKNILRKKSY